MQRGEEMEVSCVNELNIGQLCELHGQGYEFLVEDGVIKDVIHE